MVKKIQQSFSELLKKVAPLCLFAFVFLPPKKEEEDWASSVKGNSISTESISEDPVDKKTSRKIFQANAKSSRFSYNGKDTLFFSQNAKGPADWETKLPPIEKYFVWPSGAWSGISLSTHSLHHFYTRAQKKGPEPRYRSYELGADWDIIDADLCNANHAVILEKSAAVQKTNEPSFYRLLVIAMVPSQELKRENYWSLTVPSGQDVLKLSMESCGLIYLDGWPKSFKVSLKQ